MSAGDKTAGGGGITRAAGMVSAATLLSRIFGFIRDCAIAWAFGAGLYSDAFLVAFRIPNLFRRLFAEGVLSAAFIPLFSEFLTKRGKTRTFGLVLAAFRRSSVISAVIVMVSMIAAPLLVYILAPGFAVSSDKYALTVFLTRVMLPYILFISLTAVAMGALNSLGYFGLPALMPFVFNLVLICAVLFISPLLPNPVFGLAIGVLAGGVLQFAILFGFLIKLQFLKISDRLPDSEMARNGLAKISPGLFPTILGAGVYHINILTGSLMASFLPGGSVSHLYYADRLVQFPLGIFAVAAATAVLPSFSVNAAQRDFESIRKTLIKALKLVFFFTLPAMAGLIVLRKPIIILLFKRGLFDLRAAGLTAEALLYFSLGLWAYSASRVLVTVFYGLQDARTPAKIAVMAIIFNIMFCFLFLKPLGHGGLALATAMAAVLQFTFLTYAARSKIGSIFCSDLIKTIAKSIISSVFMGMSVWVLLKALAPVPGDHFSVFLFKIAICIISGIMTYLICSVLSGNIALIKVASRLIKQGDAENAFTKGNND